MKKERPVKTTIVGGQPPGNERPLQKIPVGIEQILAMAAVDDKFAKALLENREKAIKASGVELTPTETQIVLPIDNNSLKQMIKNVRGRIPAKERRAFIKKSAAALLALVSAGFLTLGSGCESQPAPVGERPDRPQPKPVGERPDRPRKK